MLFAPRDLELITREEKWTLGIETAVNGALFVNKLMVDIEIWPQKYEILGNIVHPRKIARLFSGNYPTHGALMILGFSAGYIGSKLFTNDEAKRVGCGIAGALAIQTAAEFGEYIYETGFNLAALGYTNLVDNFMPKTDFIGDLGRGALVTLVAVGGYFAGRGLYNRYISADSKQREFLIE
ncbi:MAG: hypothetical protein NDI94_03360 [Candidatus Woesearchaeota archaeon]|nr:hypothetical protein [Candidatus Woesearchaeota archaeon]